MPLTGKAMITSSKFIGAVLHRDLVVFWIAIASLLTFYDPVSGQVSSGDQLKLPEGFHAELLYTVPADQGSWVSMTTDPQGRLIASDQYGFLYRIQPGQDGVEIEKIELGIGFAQGLLCAFDSLYVVSYGIDPKARGRSKGASEFSNMKKRPAGLYRVRDTNGDDQFDSVKLLREFQGKSEHGPHAVILSPDQKSLFICAGNATQLPNPETSRVPRLWQEDQLLTRLPDARGHAAGRLAPGGWICKTDPDGKKFELVAMGFRNQYDIAFDPNGELFTYDADMEWDVNLPWYRPTRVCHVVSGSEFGWRHGSGKFPEYYPDNVSPAMNVGPGSPTGIVFGTGAKFPAKYQNCLFISDWSYGMIYAVHLTADGSSFRGTKEKFCSAPALPVTDLVINPSDGAMYFLIGGRRSQSALYRISYRGNESTDVATYPASKPAIQLRRKLESYHLPNSNVDFDFVWDQLASEDRSMRYAARTVLELQPIERWLDRAKHESHPQRILELTMAIARLANPEHKPIALGLLSQLKWTDLSESQQIHLLRNYGILVCRMGTFTSQQWQPVVELENHFPTGKDFVDRELAKLLIAAQVPQATAKVVKLMNSPSAPEPQIAYAMMLADAKMGWTDELRQNYFRWFLQSQKSKGGNSFGGYINNIKKHAIGNLSQNEIARLDSILNQKPESVDPYADLKAKPFVKNWSLEDILPLEESVFVNRDIENGKKLFAVASCYRCHRMEGQGGIVGPDLTPAGNRFSTKDLLETIIDPSKEVSDQYEATVFLMMDGTTITGRVANLSGNVYQIQTNMIDPGNFTRVKVDEIDEMKPSKTSMMPSGLLDNFTKDEILDLLAYMKSTGPNGSAQILE
ncbi:MAG: c-type cytochrome [Planctomycetota bacterium]